MNQTDLNMRTTAAKRTHETDQRLIGLARAESILRSEASETGAVIQRKVITGLADEAAGYARRLRAAKS